MGRPAKDIDAESVSKLPKLGCNQDEIADFFGGDSERHRRAFPIRLPSKWPRGIQGGRGWTRLGPSRMVRIFGSRFSRQYPLRGGSKNGKQATQYSAYRERQPPANAQTTVTFPCIDELAAASGSLLTLRYLCLLLFKISWRRVGQALG
jgi:hypothetical protein